MKAEDFIVKSIGGWTLSYPLEHPIMVGAGACRNLKGPESVEELTHSASAAIVVGSMTLKERPGHSGEIFRMGNGFSWNCAGLPSPALYAWKKQLPEMVALAHKANKPLFISLAGNLYSNIGISQTEWLRLIEESSHSRANLIELNFSCPNTETGIIGYDLEATFSILRFIKQQIDDWWWGPPLAVKLPLFYDPFTLQAMHLDALEKIMSIIWPTRIFGAVVSTNTFPVSLIKDESWRQRIIAAGGSINYGAVGGPILKSANIKQIKYLKENYPHVDLVAVGGVATGKDVADYLQAGAKIVQVTSVYLKEGIKAFDRLLMEFVDEFDKLKTNSGL